MSDNRTKRLVEDALGALWKPYGENVTDEVLEVIENDPTLLGEYHKIASEFDGGIESLNQNIGEFVKKTTGAKRPFRRKSVQTE